jgi:transcriptional regulator with XRE-family HTH domain
VDDFGTRLREAIDAAGLTQLQLAQQIGVQPNLVSSWVRGKSLPSVPNLAKLVSALRADAGWLLLGDTPKRDRHDPVARKVRQLGCDLIELVEIARNAGSPPG